MIYKFNSEDGEKNLEVFLADYQKSKVVLSIKGNGIQYISLDKNNIYDLIGALHTLKSKMNG